MTKKSKPEPEVRCKGCGAPEQKGLLTTNIAPHLGYCVTCINRAMQALKQETQP